jgi:hypothetical protein
MDGVIVDCRPPRPTPISHPRLQPVLLYQSLISGIRFDPNPDAENPYKSVPILENPPPP